MKIDSIRALFSNKTHREENNNNDYYKKISRKNNIIETVNMIAYYIYILVYVVTLVLFGMGNDISNWRYYILAILIIISFMSMIAKYGKDAYKKELYCKELLFVIITGIVFLLLSIFKANEAGIPLSYRTFVQISLFLMPALYILNFINIFSIKKIFSIMKVTTIIMILLYFFEPMHYPIQFFDYNNWANISFSDSNSFTESHNFAEAFLQLFLFFYYFKHKVNEIETKKSLTIFTVITFIFTIMCFKRLGIIFAIFVVLFRIIIKKYDRKIPFRIAFIFTIIFTGMTIIYTKFMQGQLFTDIYGYDEIFKLTSGRNWILTMWENKDYLSYGYGSSMLVIGRYLEMDLVQIYLELNIFALLLFCFTFTRIARRNIYSNLIILYVFTNMLTSSTMPWTIGWIMMLITVSCISSEKYEKENSIN